MDFPHGVSVTVLTPAVLVDPYSGEPTAEDWTSPARTVVRGVAVIPGASVSVTDTQRAGFSTTLTLLMPPGTAVSVRSRVELAGEVWQVAGDIIDYHHPLTGWAPGVSVPIKRVRG